MSFLGSIGKGIWNAATSPIRVITNGAKTIGNALLCVKDVATLDMKSLKTDAADMGKDAVKTAFAGAESLLTYGTLGWGGLALGAGRAAAAEVAVEGLGLSTAQSLGGSFLAGMLEPS